MAQQLDVWIEGFPKPLGTLSSDDDGAIAFRYLDSYLAEPEGFPISLSLPLQPEPFDDALTRAFFRNLLPENDQLQQVLEREGLDAGDVVGILAHLGADLSGALSCLPAGSPPVKVPGNLKADYVPLANEELSEIVVRLGNNWPLPGELKDPSPVAGLQRKIALVAIDDQFAIPVPRSGAPTTHILKVPGPGLTREAYYEAWCSSLAREAGLDAAVSTSRWIGQYEVVISTRFDRTVAGDLVTRVHQEDFAQALGLPPRFKYERDGRAGRTYDASAIRSVLEHTVVPAEATFNFLRITFFNLAVGNTDNHAKNHALLYDRGPTPRLAPLYDLVPIRLSDVHHHKFSFRVGQADEITKLNGSDIVEFLGILGLSGVRAARFLSRDIVPLIDRLNRLPEPRSDWDKRFFRQIGEDSRRLQRTIEDAIEIARSPTRRQSAA